MLTTTDRRRERGLGYAVRLPEAGEVHPQRRVLHGGAQLHLQHRRAQLVHHANVRELRESLSPCVLVSFSIPNTGHYIY